MPSLPIVAIVGRPNVGKSTLFNRLWGRRHALVRDEPGITRDRQYGECDWDEIKFRILDTGGIELHPKTSLQQKMTEQAFMGIEEAALLLVLMDGRAGLTHADREWMESVRKLGKPTLYVVNKIDAETQEAFMSDFYELGVNPLIPISSETGRGIAELLDGVKKNLIEQGFKKDIHIQADASAISDDIFKISLIGRPNVGKSTLLNRLLGFERAIADPVPGTTRDTIDSYLSYEGETFCIVDTAGIRKRGKTTEAIEKFSVMKSLKAMAHSDIALVLLDANEGVTEQDAHVAGEAAKRFRAILFLVNKWDEAVHKISKQEFLDQIERCFPFASYVPILFISAKTGKGTDRLFPTIERLRKQYEKRISTGDLNREFERIVESHPLPVHAGKNIKIFFSTQIGIKPPTFVIFSNQPKKIHFSYERYLVNSLREAFGFNEVPLKIIFRKKN